MGEARVNLQVEKFRKMVWEKSLEELEDLRRELDRQVLEERNRKRNLSEVEEILKPLAVLEVRRELHQCHLLLLRRRRN